MTVENTVSVESLAEPAVAAPAETHGVELTDGAAIKARRCSSRRAVTTCGCASPCSPADAPACATSCSSTSATLDGDLVPDFNGVDGGRGPDERPYLLGAAIDFVDTIEKQGFTIDNPNATSSCACGDSFN